LVQTCQAALTETMHPQGFNIGINQGKVAGAGIVEHLHIHVVPRWNGDSNFMPVIGQTSILPQALSEVAENLRKAICKLQSN
ncbi:MAG: HIT domain-containing protein, partial [Verrucomicrobia bacterium]|nr:HIT domain-containing protein [Verrucomicrobiota bacterium]